MKTTNNNNFSEIFPPHEHRRLHILLSILAFLLVAGSIIVYQMKYAEKQIIIKKTDFTPEEKNIAFNNELVRLSKAIADTGMGQKPLTSAELKAIADNFNKAKK